MHPFLVIIGLVFVLMIFVHIIFRVIKFTVMIFLLGFSLIAVLSIFQHAFGIDLMQIITGNPTPPVVEGSGI